MDKLEVFSSKFKTVLLKDAIFTLYMVAEQLLYGICSLCCKYMPHALVPQNISHSLPAAKNKISIRSIYHSPIKILTYDYL